jgi:hypothetical protein
MDERRGSCHVCGESDAVLSSELSGTQVRDSRHRGSLMIGSTSWDRRFEPRIAHMGKELVVYGGARSASAVRRSMSGSGSFVVFRDRLRKWS